MGTGKSKSTIVTFKADAALIEAMKGIPNRSDFIRQAVATALEGACPLCRGTGFLTPGQRSHWDNFAKDHSVLLCEDCNELYVACSNRERLRQGGSDSHRGKSVNRD